MREPLALLKDSITFFQTHWKLFTGIYLVQGIFFLACNIYIYYQGNGSEATGIEGILGVVIALIVFALGILMSTALVLAVQNPSLTVTDAYKEARKFFFSYLLLSIMVGLVVLGGFILLIIPGIIFVIWFGFSHYFLVLENIRGVEAMKRSKALVKGRWMAVFLRMLLLIGCAVVVAFIVGIVEVIGSETIVSVLVREVVYLAMNAVLASVGVIYCYFLYKDLKSTSAA